MALGTLRHGRGRVEQNRGFLTLSLTGYIMLGLGAVILLLGIALRVQTARLDSAKEEHAKFVATVKAQGELAEQKRKEKEKLDASRIKEAVTERDRALARLRDSARVSKLSPSPSAPAGSAEVCIGAEAYNAAFARFRERLGRSLDGLNGLAIEGDQAQIDAEALLRAWPR